MPKSLVLPTKPCSVCGPTTASLKYTKSGYQVVKCDGCGLVYLDHVVTAEDLREFYSREYFTGGEDRKGYADYLGDRENIKRSFESKLHQIEAMKTGGSLLDIGCAAGFFLEVASDHGWRVFGQEVSEYAGSFARQRFGDDIFVGPIEAMQLPEKALDVVTMWDVIEHLADPAAALSRVRKWLKDDGLFVLCTGNIDSQLARFQGKRSRIFNPPQHLYFFSRDSLTKLLNRAGLKVVRTRTDSKSMSFEYITYVLAEVNSNFVFRLLHRLISRTRWAKTPLWLPLIDNMQLYASVQPDPAQLEAPLVSPGRELAGSPTRSATQ